MNGSANGFLLEVGGHEIAASWPAPFFSLVLDDADEPCAPLLFHCESLEDAIAKRGVVLDGFFNRVERGNA